MAALGRKRSFARSYLRGDGCPCGLTEAALVPARIALANIAIIAANASRTWEAQDRRAAEVPYRDVRWRRTSRYSCQINPITKTSKTVKTMRPKPWVYEKR